MVWSLTCHAAGGVGIIRANFSIAGVAVDHRIHVAGRNTKIQIRLAQLHEVFCAVPIGLCDNSHSEALGLKRSSNDRHAKAGGST